MALTELFNDRKARKFIRESINEASEIGTGYCSFCGHEHRLLQAFEGVNLCEHCAERLLEKADDYDRVFDSTPTGQDALDMLDEAYFYVDTKKLEADAKSNFGGSVPDLIRSYGLKLAAGKYGWNEKYDRGIIWLDEKDVKGTLGSGTKTNRFLSDYNAKVGRKMIPISPDADGYQYSISIADGSFISDATKGVQGSAFLPGVYTQQSDKRKSVKSTFTAPTKAGSGAQAVAPQANTSQVPASPAPAPTPVSTVTNNPTPPTPTKAPAPAKSSKGSLRYSGDKNQWYVAIGKGTVKFIMTLQSELNDVYTYDLELFKGTKSCSKDSVVIKVPGGIEKDFDSAARQVIDAVVKSPSTYIPSFAGEAGTFSINKYGVYEFAFDEYSFSTGKDLTMAVVYNGKVASSKRVIISDDALLNRAVLNTQLTKYMDDTISAKYPILFSKDSIIQTSIGKVNFTFQGFDSNDKPIVSALLGNQAELTFTITGDALKDKTKARETLLNALYSGFTKIIPGFYDNKFNPKGDGKFDIPMPDVGPAGGGVWADFDLDAFMDRGDISFKVSVYDDHTGNERPQKAETFIYRKAGTPIETFLSQVGHKLYKECFGKSSMVDVMTKSAQDKLKVPGKKQALFDKIAGIFVKKYPEVKQLKECEVEVDMDVNKEGKVIDALITVRDPYNDLVETSRELASLLNLEKTVKFIKFFKAHPEVKDGPAVSYKVTDVEAFSQAIDLRILEHLIFEAFGITYISESGRKVISA